MDTRKIASLVLFAAASISVTACDSSSPVTPTATLASESSDSTNTNAPETATSTQTFSDQYHQATAEAPAKNIKIPKFPEAAKQNNEKGAFAFTTHYFDLINYTGESTESEPIKKLSSSQCQECFESIIDPADHSKSIGEWQVGGKYHASILDAYKSSEQRTLVTVEFTSDAFKTYMQPNVVAGEYSEVKATVATFQLKFTDRWQVEKILMEEQ